MPNAMSGIATMAATTTYPTRRTRRQLMSGCVASSFTPDYPLNSERHVYQLLVWTPSGGGCRTPVFDGVNNGKCSTSGNGAGSAIRCSHGVGTAIDQAGRGIDRPT